MVAVDTNVLVRLVTNDNAAQAARAAAIFSAGPVFIAKSVLLEAEWVLRFGYELRTASILRALRAVLGLDNVAVEDPVTVVAALRLLEHGVDFGDALHVVCSNKAARFVTFDSRLVKRTQGATAVPVVFA